MSESGIYEKALRQLKEINRLDPFEIWSVYPNSDNDDEVWACESTGMNGAGYKTFTDESFFKVIQTAHDFVSEKYRGGMWP